MEISLDPDDREVIVACRSEGMLGVRIGRPLGLAPVLRIGPVARAAQVRRRIRGGVGVAARVDEVRHRRELLVGHAAELRVGRRVRGHLGLEYRRNPTVRVLAAAGVVLGIGIGRGQSGHRRAGRAAPGPTRRVLVKA